MERTRIKILGSHSMLCETKGCLNSAEFLFRTGNGPIAGFCQAHARAQAAALKVRLPELPLQKLRAGF